jgi:uncharacterized membrane protein
MHDIRIRARVTMSRMMRLAGERRRRRRRRMDAMELRLLSFAMQKCMFASYIIAACTLETQAKHAHETPVYVI